MVTINAPEITEILSNCGFDWLFVDGEHGAIDADDIRTILLAAGDRIDCLVRVPALDETPIKKALDLGAAGIIVPQVNNAEQAAEVVDYCRYPPEGSRGTGLARAHGYGSKFEEYTSTANEKILVVVQAEHRDAVENIESIVSVPGIDVVFIGPYDLSASYGKSGQVNDPEVLSAIDRIESVCKAADMPLGIFGVSADSVASYVKRGYQLITAGVDSLLISRGAKEIQAALAQMK